MMTPRKLQLFKFLLFFALAVMSPAILLLRSGSTKADGKGIAVTMGCLLLIAAVHGWKYWKTPVNAVFYNLSKQAPEEQLRMSRRLVKLLAVTGPVMGYMAYADLLTLQSGTVKSVSLFAPTGWVYGHFGFWPAVLTWPMICGYAIMKCVFRIERAKALLGYRETSNQI